LYTNSFGGTKLRRNYIWGYGNKKKVEQQLDHHDRRVYGEVVV
jgi:hypothetical protein